MQRKDSNGDLPHRWRAKSHSIVSRPRSSTKNEPALRMTAADDTCILMVCSVCEASCGTRDSMNGQD